MSCISIDERQQSGETVQCVRTNWFVNGSSTATLVVVDVTDDIVLGSRFVHLLGECQS